MFRRQRISVFIIVFGLLIAIGTGLKAHWYHDAKIPDLKFTSEAAISCNIDGYTFTHTRQTYTDGVIYEDGWWRNPQDPKVEMTAEAHGAGWATVTFYGNIDGSKKGSETPDPAKQLGSWVGFLPVGAGLDHTVGGDFSASFNRSPKTYKWNASGSIKLVPVYWKWRFGLPVPTGSWEEASSIHHDDSAASTNGDWEVERNWTTLNRPSPGSSPTSPSEPTDNTPNCMDCTSDCSSPCSCTNSGTCGGTATTPPPPAYHACGVHETSVSGDHSLQTSCSSSNSNGNCTVTNFYACDSHTHAYPSAQLRQCGQHTKAEGGDHRFLRCSACNGPHWSCNATSVDRHRLRTCRYGTCGNTWRKCQSSTPNCSSPNRPGEKCWAQ